MLIMFLICFIEYYYIRFTVSFIYLKYIINLFLKSLNYFLSEINMYLNSENFNLEIIFNEYE